MTDYRLSEAARVLGVSDDTVRRWAEQGQVQTVTTESGVTAIEGGALAALVADRAHLEDAAGRPSASSARNRLPGIVVKVTRDTVMAQVELACGPFRIVSLMSREAVESLGLEPGVLAEAVVKATTVVVDSPR